MQAEVAVAWPEIIVPIHNGSGALARCLDSLRRTLSHEHTVQLVDDASREPEVAALLGAIEREPPCRITITRQCENLGFVGTVNAAMSRTRADVILLNSDTVVTSGWIERLRACLAADARIATATPWSNNAEICSFPEFCRANPEPADAERVARACRASGQSQYPDLPTAVGFCMAIRRRVLDQIGDFDQSTFGRGYGEENDFCLRAAAHGWRNVLCDDAYVVHQGGASFGPLGHAPGGENLARLVARYPRYNALVADFIARDPLAARRAQIVAALAAAEVAA
jgi:GT2 family glycosyltransferase